MSKRFVVGIEGQHDAASTCVDSWAVYDQPTIKKAIKAHRASSAGRDGFYLVFEIPAGTDSRNFDVVGDRITED